MCLSMLMSSFAFTAFAQDSASEETTEKTTDAVPVFSLNYTEKVNGTVNNKKTAILEKNFMLGDKKTLLVTPNTENPDHVRIALDCFNLTYTAEQLAKCDYVTVEYMYLTPPEITGFTGKMMLSLLSNGKALKQSVDINAVNGMIKDKWTTAVFDLEKVKAQLNETGTLAQFQLCPFGYNRDPKNMHPGEMIYIGEITFWSGEPEIEYPEVSNTPVVVPPSSEGPLVFTIDYGSKCMGIVDNKKTATITKNHLADDKNTVKIVPTPDTANHVRLGLDCHSLGLPASYLAESNFVEIDYKYVVPDGVAGSKGRKMMFSILASGGAVSASTDMTSDGTIVGDGQWHTMVVNLAPIKSKVDPDAKFDQFHFFPFGYTTDPKTMNAGEEMYIGEIRFLREIEIDTSKPEVFSFHYGDQNNGLVDGGKTATIKKDVMEEGVRSLEVVPNTVDPQKAFIALDCFSINYDVSQLKDVKFITIKYKYVCPEGVEGQSAPMNMSILSNGGAVKETIYFNSTMPLEKNKWTTATFNTASLSKVLNTSGTFKQMHLRPFGQSANPAKMHPEEKIYIETISFLRTNPDQSSEYTISFLPGHPLATGTNPEAITVKNKEEYILPENPYTFENGKFFGWLCSYDETIYPAGTKMEAVESPVIYTAQFKDMAAAPDVITVKISDFASGIVSSRDTGKITKGVDFEGHTNVLKLDFNPATSSPNNDVVIDGHKYEPAGIDLSMYNYAVIDYYFAGDLGDRTPKMLLGLLANGGALKTSVYCESEEPIVAGSWQSLPIDISKAVANINPNTTNHTLKQMHIYCGTGYKAKDFKDGESIYIDTITFFKENPDFTEHTSYMKGYDGGLFKPQGNMTRAEACTIVARLTAGGDANVPADKTSAFSDVTADQWYYKYVSYVESLGYLGSYSGSFLPNEPITRAEFVELVYNMGLLSDKGLNGTFTDVAAGHPRAAVIAAAGKAGLVSGYDNGDGTFSFMPDNTITRAEVVKVINNAYERSISKDALANIVSFSFVDVEPEFWAFADICEATLDHSESAGKWVALKTNLGELLGGDARINLEAGKAYIAELDKISEEKKNAIRATPTTVNVTGTKYYVSNTTGNDANDGLTPETAWASVAKVNSFDGFAAGDGVFFKRGDLFRERLTTAVGVTYSAYGEGDKPKFYTSPENGAGAGKWTLYHEDANTGAKIWTYHRNLLDVGAIFINDGEKVAVKAIPDVDTKEVGKYYDRKTKELFDVKTSLNDMEFFSETPFRNYRITEVPLYFRCDAGNPGEIFGSIEFNVNGSGITARKDVTIDNLCIMYAGVHGISAGTVTNLTVTNCEIGFIGGALQQYDSNGTAVRLGNGVEIYGGCDGYMVDNCYIYQCYDAGVTHQYSAGGTDSISMYNIVYSNNLIEDCIYAIEYFTGEATDPAAKRDGKNYKITDNILRRSGYGWGVQRSTNENALIKGWNARNEYEQGTFVIQNNILDRATNYLIQTGAQYDQWSPVYSGNTFIQIFGGKLGYHTDALMQYDNIADMTIKHNVGDKNATVYWLPDEYKRP